MTTEEGALKSLKSEAGAAERSHLAQDAALTRDQLGEEIALKSVRFNEAITAKRAELDAEMAAEYGRLHAEIDFATKRFQGEAAAQIGAIAIRENTLSTTLSTENERFKQDKIAHSDVIESKEQLLSTERAQFHEAVQQQGQMLKLREGMIMGADQSIAARMRAATIKEKSQQLAETILTEEKRVLSDALNQLK